jgi:hypothetical protein
MRHASVRRWAVRAIHIVGRFDPSVRIFNGMSRISFLALTLFALSASAVPIAPLEPRLQHTFYADTAPEAASDGASSLVVWTTLSGALPFTGSIYVRIPDRQSTAVSIGGGGLGAQAAWNGTYYLVGYGTPGSRGRSDFPDLTFRIVHPDGVLGAQRQLSTSPFGEAIVDDLIWDGRHWRASFTEGTSSVVTLDRELNVVGRVVLPEARRVTFTEIDGQVWAVQTLRTGGAEAFALDEESTRYRIDVDAELSGRLAFLRNATNLQVALFDPRNGFSAPTARIDGATLLDAHPFAGGARIVYRIGARVFLAAVDRTGSITQTSLVAEPGEGALAAVTDDEVFVSVAGDIRAYPSSEVISLVDTAAQRNPIVVATGDHATAFWVQTTDDGEATFTRKIDANGIPFGEITELPFTITPDADAAFDGVRAILVWAASPDGVFAYDGQTVHFLGKGSQPSIATSAHGTFIVWTGADGMVRGTPFPQIVPDGITILPSLSSWQGTPHITPLGDGFMILWTAESLVSVVISPAGTVRTSSVFAHEPQAALAVDGTLAAFPSTLFAFAPNGQPFERFDPHWGESWSPVAIHHLGNQRHHVTISRNGALYASVVTMEGAWITGITPLELLGVYPFASVTRIGNRTIVVHGQGRVEVDAHGGPIAKRRAARR